MIALPEWRVLADEASLARAAADILIEAAQSAAHPAICLTGGSSPRALFALLADAPLDWARVHWFIGDERRAPLASPDSNMGQAMRLLLDSRAPRANIHPIPVETATLEEAARLYESELRAFAQRRGASPLFDLVLLGLGPDGHVASLFPGQPAVDENRAWVVPVERPGLAPVLPRVSLTLPALAACRRMLFMVNGASKAQAVARIAGGADLPGARARSAERTTWLLDEAAAPALPREHAPRRVLVMGVSGAGKTTLGLALAQRLGSAFLDADDLHPPQNRAKLHAGEPLTDADRAPWLDAVRADMQRASQAGRSLVVACSALKRAYRDRLFDGEDARAWLVHLRVAPDVLARRLAHRAGHFMSPALLPDQLRTLEEPAAGPNVLLLDANAPVGALVDRVVARLNVSP